MRGRIVNILSFLAVLLLPPLALAQGTGPSFPTPAGPFATGFAIMVPTGPITSGQPVVAPPTVINPLPVVCTTCSPSAPIGASTNPVSGTIASTGVFQSLIAQNNTRRACSFQNQGTHNMTIRVVGATLGQIIPAFGMAYCSPNTNVTSTDAIEITGTAGDAFSGGWQ